MKPLSDRFEFDDDAIAPGDEAMLQGTIWKVYDKANGFAERRLRTWRKTGTKKTDEELRFIWRHEMRQVRRLMRRRDAHDLIVDVLEELEDDHEFALLLADRGEPIASDRRSGKLLDVPIGRKRILIWRNISRIARAIGILHDQSIIHGRLTFSNIFSEGGAEPDFRLTGFEWSVSLTSDTYAKQGKKNLTRSKKPLSFRADWAALGDIAAALVGEPSSSLEDQRAETTLSAPENSLLNLLRIPRPNQPLDARIVSRSIDAIVADLQRAESGRRGQLILLPNPTTLSPKLIEHLGGGIDPEDYAAHCRWIQEDLRTDVRVAARYEGADRQQCELVTSNFRYIIEPMRNAEDWRIGYLKTLIPNDGRGTGTAEPRSLDSPVQVYPNRREASDASRRLGTSAVEWDQYAIPTKGESLPPPDVRDALLVIEAIEAVAATLDAFPVRLLSRDLKRGRVTLAIRTIPEHIDLVEKAGLRPDVERLPELLDGADDTPWRLSNSPKLGWSGLSDVDAHLVHLGSAGAYGQEFIFECPEVPEGDLFLKPPRQLGNESQVRRRLRNIVLLDGRTDVTVGLDDPWGARRNRVAAELSGRTASSFDKPKLNAFELVSRTEPYVYIVGPPGVGKTYFVSKLVEMILDGKPDARILVTAQSHEALKNIHETLSSQLSKAVMAVRIGNDDNRFSELDAAAIRAISTLRQSNALAGSAYSKLRRLLDDSIAEYSGPSSARPQMISRVGDLLLHSANVVFAALNSLAVSDFVENSEEFDWLIVEEAARAFGPELAGALSLAPRKILIGDHNQLPPYRADQVARRFEPEIARRILQVAEERLDLASDSDELLPMLRALLIDDARFRDTISRANRLLEPFRTIVTDDEREAESQGEKHRRVSVTLTEQRRMHPAIAEVVSNVFYSGKLSTAPGVESRPVPFTVAGKLSDAPIEVVDFPSLQSTGRRESFEQRFGKSLSNPSEADELIKIARCLSGVQVNGVKPTLAMLSPYNGQVELIRQKLRLAFPDDGTPTGFRPVREDLGFVGSVDAFQGSEADVVLLSLVRNNEKVGGGGLGFLRDRRRMNVALSRAKHKLVIVTSLKFIDLAAKGINPRGDDPKWKFLREMVRELRERSARADGVRLLSPGGDE